MTVKQYQIQPGDRTPTGASVQEGGVNFCIFSRYATDVELLLYQKPDSSAPFQVIRLDIEENRTFFFWHVFIEQLPAGISYTWRVDGPGNTRETGYRYDPAIELVDPWARLVTDPLWDRHRACHGGNEANAYRSMRAMVMEDKYDWEGDEPLVHAPEDTIIYEMHVGGFTRHASSNVKHPGTFSGITEKIPYLQELGITAVELLPVMAFDEQDIPEGGRLNGLKNYWGYSTHSFYAPHSGYCISPLADTQQDEFRDMVKALHKAGIAVILDVVFNHTAEGGADGPTINFKGFGNGGFYHLEPDDKRNYKNFSGCGNAVNCNHPLVSRFIIECLEYWVDSMHVDGFRFDLASVLARGEDGEPMYHAPVIWGIEFSQKLVHTQLIAEAWDAAGLYQVGDFPGFRWAEWNGLYRDVIRQFVAGGKELVEQVATRMSGSSDLYKSEGRLPWSSINFVTCHDGFTLYDLVSYNDKHNEANGEQNRDGTNENYSWNCGREGESSDQEVQALRQRQVRNVMAILLLSQGVPMLLAGDEMLNSQWGNNNAYCQDSELSWLDWSLLDKNQDMFRFVRLMIALRKRHGCLRRKTFLLGDNRAAHRLSDVTWHGLELNEPLWGHPQAQVLGFTLGGMSDDEEDLHIMMNMSDACRDMAIPVLEKRNWYRSVDTALPSPEDIIEPESQPIVTELTYGVRPRSVVVLESRAC